MYVVIDIYEHPFPTYEIEEKDVEQWFAMMKSSTEVDDDFAARETELTDMSASQQFQLDLDEEISLSKSGSIFDDELEFLRKQIDNL